MKAMRTERNSVGLVEAPSDKLSGDANSRMEMSSSPAQDVYEIRPRKERDGFDLISDGLRRGPIWYSGPDAGSQRDRVREVALPLALTLGDHPRVQ